MPAFLRAWPGAQPTTRADATSAGGVGSVRYYRPELDALRFGAFLLVFLHHAFPRHPVIYAEAIGPEAAVAWASAVNALGCGLPLFFALSGFLITELLSRETAATGRVDLRRFWARRILRIWPLYTVGVALGVVVALWAAHRQWHGWFGDARMLAAYATFTANLFVAGLDRWTYNPMTLLWSLSIEEQFYLAWPLAVLALRGRWLLPACAGVLALSIVRARALGDAGASADVAIWADTIVQFGMFAVGAALSLLLGGTAPAWSPVTRILLALVAALLWFQATLVFRIKDLGPAVSGADMAVGYLCVAAGCGMLLLAVLGSGAGKVRPFVTLGRISFGLYVFHVLVLMVIEHASLSAFGTATMVALKIVLGFPLTVLVAAASYRWLERPFLAVKGRMEVVRTGPA